jgi:hypothetical protein
VGRANAQSPRSKHVRAKVVSNVLNLVWEERHLLANLSKQAPVLGHSVLVRDIKTVSREPKPMLFKELTDELARQIHVGNEDNLLPPLPG